MGGAFIGLADGVETVHYNPAGLGHLETSQVTAMIQTPALDTSRNHLAGNYAWKSERHPGGVGLSWLHLASRDIEVTSDDERILGQDNLTNDALQLAGGVKLSEHWAAGAAAKFLRFAFHGFQEKGLGYDVAAHGVYGPFRLGGVVTDVGGTEVKGDSTLAGAGEVTDRVPMRLRLGSALALVRPLRWDIDVNALVDYTLKLQDAQDPRLSLGAECWTWQRRAAFRAGYRESGGPTLGLGLRLGSITFDYAYLLSLTLRDEHRLGTTYRF